MLTNTLSAPEAKAILAQETFARQTLSFYRYTNIESPKTLRDTLFRDWSELGVLGRVYVAHEGINAQISVPVHHLDAFRTHLDAIPEFAQTPFKLALEESAPAFWKLTIKVRKQIVADNLPADAYDMENVGTHLNAQAFHKAIEAGAITIDMRNKYESDIGRFENAITPSAQTFHDELQEVQELLKDRKQEKILLYCTGGIRCEKASAFLKKQGFSDVNQLSGGIIQYAHEVRSQGLASKFLGKNFVFDGRMSEKVTDDILGTCFTCNQPADSYDNCPNDLCHMLFIQCDSCRKQMLGACSPACVEIVKMPEETRKALRKGKKAKFLVQSS